MRRKYRIIGGHRYKLYGKSNTKIGAKELKSFAKEAGYKARIVGGRHNYRVYYHK